MLNKNNRFAARPAVATRRATVCFTELFWAYNAVLCVLSFACVDDMSAELCVPVIRKPHAKPLRVEIINVSN